MERLRSPEESGVVLILGTTDWQRLMIYKEMLRIDPQLEPIPAGDAAPGAIVEVSLPY